jgi:hypothetical protein
MAEQKIEIFHFDAEAGETHIEEKKIEILYGTALLVLLKLQHMI